MARYSPERKESILKKLLPSLNMTVSEVTRSEGISSKTLYHWRDVLRREGQPVPGKTLTSNDWSAEAKLAVIIETAAMSKTEISQYCREKNVFREQILEWKKDCLGGFKSGESQAKNDKVPIESR